MSNALEELRRKRANGNLPSIESNTEAAPQRSYAGNLLQSAVGQGLGLGFGDEIEGAIRAGISQFSDDPQTYSQARDVVRNQIKQFQETNPGTAITAEIVGGMIPTAVALLTGVGAPAAAANTARLGAVAARAKQSIPIGAAAGIGYSEEDDFDGLTNDAAVGAATAFVSSEAFNQAAKAAGGSYVKLITFIRNKFGNEYVGPVTEYLNRLRERTGKTIDETVSDVARGGVMAEDDQLGASLRAMAAEGGEASGDLKTAASARATATMENAERSLRTAMAPDVEGDNILAELQRKSDTEKAGQSLDYESVYANAPNIPQPLSQRIQAMLRVNSDVRKMFDEDYKTARLTNLNLKPLYKMVKDENGNERVQMLRPVTLKDAEDFRRNLGDMAQIQFDSPNKRNAPGFNYLEAEKTIRSGIDRMSKPLKDVRSKYADREAVDAAVKLGRRLTNADPTDIEMAMSTMSEAEIKGFRAGMAVGMRKRLADSGGNYAGQAGGLERANRTPYQRMQEVLPEDQFEPVTADLATAGRAAQNNQVIKPAGGAITQFAEEAGREKGGVGLGEIAGQAVYGNNMIALAQTAMALIPKELGLNDQQSRQVVKVLFSEDPELVRRALTDSTAMGEINQKLIRYAQNAAALTDSAIQRQAPAGILPLL